MAKRRASAFNKCVGRERLAGKSFKDAVKACKGKGKAPAKKGRKKGRKKGKKGEAYEKVPAGYGAY